MDEGEHLPSDGIGTPQGVISPLLASIDLHAFDKMWQQSRLTGTLVRYCDEFVVVSDLTEQEARADAEDAKSLVTAVELYSENIAD